MVVKQDFNRDFKVVIVIPAKDEEEAIEGVLERLLLNFSLEEIFIIADGALGRTIEIARQKKVKIIKGEGKGKGAAIKLAITNISSDILVFIDADGSHNPDDISRLIQPIKDDEADLVIASRIKGGSEEFSGSAVNIAHYVGNILSAAIVNVIWGRGKKVITDCHNGFRAIRSDVARKLVLKEDTFAIEQEMVIKCIKNGYRICEVPSYEFKRQCGRSRINAMLVLLKCAGNFIKNLF